jgi:hypothetical protein
MGVNFTSTPQGSPLDQLPVDPTNTTTTGQYYSYLVNRVWKFSTIFESAKYAPKMREDGGPDNVVYEVGTNLDLVATAQGGGTPSTNGLVAYWKFDEAADTVVADYSGNHNDGTLSRGSGWTYDAQVDGALDFSNEILTVPDSDSMELTGDMTISFIWKNLADSGTAYTNHVIQKGDWGNEVMEYSLQLQSAAGSSGYAGSASGWVFNGESRSIGEGQSIWLTVAGSGDTLEEGIFHLVTIVRSASSAKVYQDGDLLYEDAHGYGTLEASSDPFWIGQGAEKLPAILDEFRIYNRALSQAEIQRNNEHHFRAPFHGLYRRTGVDSERGNGGLLALLHHPMEGAACVAGRRRPAYGRPAAVRRRPYHLRLCVYGVLCHADRRPPRERDARRDIRSTHACRYAPG